jgi:hypothetical protein
VSRAPRRLVALAGGLLVLAGPLGPPDAGRARVTECVGSAAFDLDCHHRRYAALTRASGVGAAFAALKADYEGNEVVRFNCHQLAHAIAHAAARGAPERGDHFCGSGYYAGRVEGHVAGATLSRLDAVCEGVRRRQPHSNNHHNCAHALGHGLMSVKAGSLTGALRGCDRLTAGWERGRCYAGVFMDDVSARARRWPETAQPLRLCGTVRWRYRRACYRQQPSYAVFVRGGDVAGVFRLCARVPERPFRRACQQGLGVDIAGRSIADHITDTGAATATSLLCALGDDVEARASCATGAVRMFVDHHRDERPARVLCESLEASLRAVCRRAGRDYYASLTRGTSERAGYCRLSES